MITEKQYAAIMEIIEGLLRVVDNDTPKDDRNFIELEVLSNLIAEYETKHHPVETPKLSEVLHLRMKDMRLTQVQLAERIGISPSSLSQLLANKGDPSYKVAKSICKELNVHPAVVLGLKDEPNLSYC